MMMVSLRGFSALRWYEALCAGRLSKSLHLVTLSWRCLGFRNIRIPKDCFEGGLGPLARDWVLRRPAAILAPFFFFSPRRHRRPGSQSWTWPPRRRPSATPRRSRSSWTWRGVQRLCTCKSTSKFPNKSTNNQTFVRKKVQQNGFLIAVDPGGAQVRQQCH